MSDTVADWERKYELLKQDYLRASDLKQERAGKIVKLERGLAAAQADLLLADKTVNAGEALINNLQAKLARYEAAGRELPEEPATIVDSLVTGEQSFDWPLVEKVSYDKLRDFAIAQKERADENERDAKSWRDFMQQVKAAQASGETSVIEVANKGQT